MAEPFRCYYCKFGCQSFQNVVDHTSSLHVHEVLKVRSRELNMVTGRTGYRTHNFQVIPKDIGTCGQQLHVKCEEPGSLSLQISRTTDEQVSILRSPLSKKPKHSEPSSPHLSQEDVPRFNDTDSDMDKVNNNEMEAYKETLTEQIPIVLEVLKENGQLDTWMRFHDMMSRRIFPVRNIAFLLFMDVVRWFSNSNTVGMRYNEHVVRFWRIGYRLFHGRFLRFMGGPKSKGQILFRDSTRGNFSPMDSHINFAVPQKKVVDLSVSPLPPEDVRPGVISVLLRQVAAFSTEEKTYKLCLDGKKINASTSGKLGDVDLFGFESTPTLLERQERLRSELKMIDDLNKLSAHFESDQDVSTLLPSVASQFKEKFSMIITLIGKRVCELRSIRVSREMSLRKFKDLAGTDWRKSNLCNVISAISTQLHNLDLCINSAMISVESLGKLCAALNGSTKEYSVTATVDMSAQMNYMHLNDITEHEFSDNTLRFLKQRTDEWHMIRSKATATGSTLNAALGLETLKAQQDHFNYVKYGKEKGQPSAQVKEKMAHGTANEINAIATIAAKVLPVFFPGLILTEEGCIKCSWNDVCMVVSPDGSLFDKSLTETRMALEIKCPYPPSPGEYKLPVFYQIPRYYIPQILAEMHALRCTSLLFVCYSRNTTCCMKAEFDAELWDLMVTELKAVFQNKAPPPKKTETIPVVKEKIESYIKHKVTFLAEVPSVCARQCRGSESTIDLPYCVHNTQNKNGFVVNVDDINLALRQCTNTFQTAYQLSRVKASEFLGFLISDLDRTANAQGVTAIPIAYGLKGYSLPTEALRGMIEYVLRECVQAGLYVPVVSFDGQWFRLTVRDSHNIPLNLIQLQKDVFAGVKKRTVSQLLADITRRNIVRASSLKDLTETVRIEVSPNGKMKVY